MQKKIETLKAEMLADLKGAKSEGEIKDVEVKYMGRSGLYNDIMKGLKDLSDEQKRTVGKEANMAKKELEAATEARRAEVENEKLGALADTEWIDVTTPGKKPRVGHRHVISQFMEDIEQAFANMGFTLGDGPEVEHEDFNFDKLNIPGDHPARDMHDTFWVKNLDKYVLRTHTSPEQIHFMESHKPPLKVVSMGKVYRKDSDATHSPMFHQLEGLMIGEDISLANLKAVMTNALQQIFQDGSIKTRFRVSYFPFVEPGMEVDCTCPICKGNGELVDGTPCRLCKQCGWLEIAGSGMVHPDVLRGVGYDPDKVTGFAFGMGLDRIVMIKHHINHLRLLFDNDLRFIRQF